MRFGFVISLLVAVTAVALVACGGSGDDDETAAPVPLAQRFVTADDASGSKPDPVETRKTTVDFDESSRHSASSRSIRTKKN